MLVLCVLSLGIGLLWVEPYYEQTFANLFLDVTGERAGCGLRGVTIPRRCSS